MHKVGKDRCPHLLLLEGITGEVVRVVNDRKGRKRAGGNNYIAQIQTPQFCWIFPASLLNPTGEWGIVYPGQIIVSPLHSPSALSTSLPKSTVAIPLFFELPLNFRLYGRIQSDSRICRRFFFFNDPRISMSALFQNMVHFSP